MDAAARRTPDAWNCLGHVPVLESARSPRLRQYPITGLVEGWYFRQRELSQGCFVVEASDVYGRKISRQGVLDVDAAMTECIEFAKQVNQKDSR